VVGRDGSAQEVDHLLDRLQRLTVAEPLVERRAAAHVGEEDRYGTRGCRHVAVRSFKRAFTVATIG